MAKATMRLRSTATPARRADSGADADRLDVLALHRAVEDHPEQRQDRGHDDDQMRDAGDPADGDVGEFARLGELQRDAAGIGVVQPDDDGAGAERGDEGIDADLGDDDAVDDADQRADADDERGWRAGSDRPAVAQQPDDQQAAEARDIADAEVEIAGDQRHGQAGRDDGADRHIVEDVAEIADRREGARLQEREDQQHRDQHDDGAVGAEQAQQCGAPIARRRADGDSAAARPPGAAPPTPASFRQRMVNGHDELLHAARQQRPAGHARPDVVRQSLLRIVLHELVDIVLGHERVARE